MKNDEKIVKWLNGELSNQEIEALKKTDDFKLYEKIAHYSAHLETPIVDAEEALAAFQKREKNKKKSKVIAFDKPLWFSMAAAFIVLLTTAYFLFYNRTTVFETQVAQTQTFRLPDDSEVILNADSKISFKKQEWEENRDLVLEGEAYFEVQKGKTFSVNTADGIVKVLGTHFNVKQRQDYFEVRCYEGLVSVTHQNNTILLPQGKTFRLINNQIENVADFTVSSPSWLQQESSFESIPLSQVISELKRQYDLKITTKDIDTSVLFTGTFTHKNTTIALEAITIPLQIRYKIEGKTVIFYKHAN
ncbi:FecR family protein [Flavobacterium sp. UMI-01]|uniref:FecR family protein n=1 Tax=Flavobacterium sp. UMI-01 TaxID=1441053 RepID=UPI001C7CBEE1|nr:FecR domain-containing protein [Flavobacterium sp. UMI-01]